ncbi:MAG: efflux RND transporter periplasmic adaptor subunit [Bacteroidaceae bacterium]|nr:efflux RND transporter periplasmic adaptor subunit [Bacteroidaceae bacterium]MBO4561973.1 efflux RND transporter periplasmic adaptor subunit [Bacteroidaceae bacterium]
MKTYRPFTTILMFAVAAVLVCGCKGKKDKDAVQDDTEMARGSFQKEKNVVTVVPLERKVFNKQLICNGKLEAQSKVTIQFEAQGKIAQINVRDGQRVQKGQILASLDKEQPRRQLEQARLAFDKAEMNLADRLLDYGYTLADTSKIPAEQKRVIYINSGFIDAKMALENAERTFNQCDLKAPFGGKAASVKGRVYEQGGQFCTLIDDSRYLVRFSVLETEYGFVSVGQPVFVTPFVSSDVVLRGKILSINPTVDQNGQIAVTAEVPGADELMDGMNVRITIENSIPDQLVVPKSAVVIRDNMEVLFRIDPESGHSLWTYVNVLMSNTTEHVVEPNKDRGADLNIGDIIITSGNLNLGDDAEVVIEDN